MLLEDGNNSSLGVRVGSQGSGDTQRLAFVFKAVCNRPHLKHHQFLHQSGVIPIVQEQIAVGKAETLESSVLQSVRLGVT